jgi:FkbM family methyltransferase
MNILGSCITYLTEKTERSWRIYNFFSKVLPTPTMCVRGIPIKIIIPLNQQGVLTSAREWEIREPETLDWIDAFTDEGIFFDVGASFGNETLYAALKSKNMREIYSFDIDLLCSHDLACNLALNHITSVTQLYIPLGSRESLMQLQEPSQYIALASKGINNVSYTALVKPLDEIVFLLNKKPSYIKIDVDGAEVDVLKGMQRTLNSSELISMLIEVSRETEADVIKIMIEAGFSIFFHTKYQKNYNTSNIIFNRKKKND